MAYHLFLNYISIFKTFKVVISRRNATAQFTIVTAVVAKTQNMMKKYQLAAASELEVMQVKLCYGKWHNRVTIQSLFNAKHCRVGFCVFCINIAVEAVGYE